MSFDEAPIKHSTEIKKTELSCIKIECTNMNGDPVKEQLNVFVDDDAKESCTMLLKGITFPIGTDCAP